MRTFTIYLVAIGFAVISCMPAHFLRPDEKEQIFSHKVPLTKDELRARVVQFINEKFVSAKSVTQSVEEGLVSGNGVFEIDHMNGLFGERIVTVRMELTFIVKYIDNQYKTKYIVKRLTRETAEGTSDLPEDRWGDYSKQVSATVSKLDFDLLAYLTNKDQEFEF